MKLVRLYGFLGEQFGTHHELEIDSPGEAIRALCATVPDFEEVVIAEQKYGFQVFVDDALVRLDKLEVLVSEVEVIKVVPVLMAAKDAGLQIIIGALLIAASFATGEAMWIPSIVDNMLFAMGASMMFGGVAQMLATTPSSSDGSLNNKSDTANYAFSGPVNTSAQGAPIPILYGRLRVGSVVVSAGIDANTFYLDNGATTQDGVRYGNGTTTPWVWAKAPVITT